MIVSLRHLSTLTDNEIPTEVQATKTEVLQGLLLYFHEHAPIYFHFRHVHSSLSISFIWYLLSCYLRIDTNNDCADEAFYGFSVPHNTPFYLGVDFNQNVLEWARDIHFNVNPTIALASNRSRMGAVSISTAPADSQGNSRKENLISKV